MNIHEQEIPTLKPAGSIVSSQSRAFLDEIKRVIAAGCNKVLIDMKDVSFISKQAVTGLVEINSSLEAEGGTLALTNLRGVVSNLILLRRKSRRLPVFTTEQQARDFFRNLQAEDEPASVSGSAVSFCPENASVPGAGEGVPLSSGEALPSTDDEALLSPGESLSSTGDCDLGTGKIIETVFPSSVETGALDGAGILGYSDEELARIIREQTRRGSAMEPEVPMGRGATGEAPDQNSPGVFEVEESPGCPVELDSGSALDSGCFSGEQPDAKIIKADFGTDTEICGETSSTHDPARRVQAGPGTLFPVHDFEGLAERILSDSPRIRWFAARGLGRLGDKRGKALLEKLIARPGEFEFVRDMARIALRRLEARHKRRES